MSAEVTKSKLLEFIRHQSRSTLSDFDLERASFESLDIDDLGTVELILSIEEEFNAFIEERVADRFVGVSDVLRHFGFELSTPTEKPETNEDIVRQIETALAEAINYINHVGANYTERGSYPSATATAGRVGYSKDWSR